MASHTAAAADNRMHSNKRTEHAAATQGAPTPAARRTNASTSRTRMTATRAQQFVAQHHSDTTCPDAWRTYVCKVYRQHVRRLLQLDDRSLGSVSGRAIRRQERLEKCDEVAHVVLCVSQGPHTSPVSRTLWLRSMLQPSACLRVALCCLTHVCLWYVPVYVCMCACVFCLLTGPKPAHTTAMEGKLSDREAEVYDRQIRLWGVEAQRRMQSSKVLLCGLTASVAEVRFVPSPVPAGGYTYAAKLSCAIAELR